MADADYRDDEPIEELPKDLELYWHTCRGGPNDGTRLLSSNYSPCKPVHLLCATEKAVIVTTPEELAEDHELRALLDERNSIPRIYVLQQGVDPASGDVNTFYAYAGEDLTAYDTPIKEGAS